MTKKLVKQEVTREIDVETGELLSEIAKQTIIHKPEQEPEFLKVYLHTLSLIHGLEGKQGQIMLAIASRMTYASKSQVAIINSYVKSEIAKEVNCSISYISNTITVLVQKGLLIRQGSVRSGAYIVNPLYIARGKWSEIKEMQLKLIFNKENKMLINATEITKNGICEEINTVETKQISQKENQQISLLDKN